VIVLAAVAVVAVAIVGLRRRRADGLAASLLRAMHEHSTGAQQAWIAAMLAEYESIDDRRVRRGFARGCLWAALRHPSPDRGTKALRAAVVVPIAAAGVLAVIGLVRYPWVRAGSWWSLYLVGFVGALMACGVVWWIGARLSSRTAALVGITLAPATLASSWMAMRSASSSSIAFALLPAGLPAIAVLLITHRDRSRDRAAAAALCGAVAVSLLFFIGAVATTYLSPTPRNAAMLAEFAKSGAPDYRTWVVADNLSGATVMLALLAMAGLASGIIAAVARAPRRRVS
jgi:hypothetical protein